MQPRRYYQQLKGTSGDVVTIDTTSASRTATFLLDGVEAKQGADWCYAEKIRLYIRTQIDQPASGGAILRPDQLYRAITGFRLFCEDLGQIYGISDLNGPQLGLIAQVVSNRYSLPFHLRADIAAADGDTAVTLVVDIPLAHRCFSKGHQTGIWNGFLKSGGKLEVTLAASTWPADVSTAAATEATTDIRAELVYTAEPEARPPVLWHWRVHETNAGETKHTLKNMCQGAGIKGVSGHGKLAFLAYLADVNGLGGADGVDNIQRIYLRDRNQGSHDLGSPFYGAASFLYDFVGETREKNVFGSAQSAGYPFALGTVVDGAPNVATALMLPLIWPDPDGQQVSKLQEWSGDYAVELGYATTPTTVGKWISLEQSYLTPEHEQYLQRERMGLPPEYFQSFAKVRGLNTPTDQQGFLQQQAKLRGLPKKFRRVR